MGERKQKYDPAKRVFSTNLLTNLTSRFSGSIHSDLDALVVHRHQGGHRGDDDVQVEALLSIKANFYFR